ncbi:hypothetical protein MFUL124B02_31810 [Myxococcus fulvus 124B02]|nr:hypothetical protein MFUL124B02_31810 [Myxococcus fulvus 124B02]
MSSPHPHHRIHFSTVFSMLALLALTWGGAARAQTFTHGIADNFTLPTEPVSPSTGMLNYIAANYTYPGSRPFDDTSIDRWFATTFTNLRRLGPICGASLRMQVRNGDFNDSMGLLFMGPTGTQVATGWGASLTSLGIPFGSTGTVSLNLASLPGGVNLIPTLNAQGFVDVFAQDDSAVDFVTLVVTQCRVDVYSKDNGADTGNTPTVDPIWVSPDIRVCQNAGCVGHQNPEFGQTNYVYVTLRNNGPLAPIGNAASGTLHVYYTGSGGAALWPMDWAPIGSISVGSIAAGANVEVMVPWTGVPAPGHYCILTRWVSSQDPMTLVELTNSNTLNNTRWNNNLAWKNINVVNLSPFAPARDFDFRVRNLLRDRPSLAHLEIRNGAPELGSFLERGQVLVTLPPELWDRWGHEGQGFEVVGERTVRIINPQGARLDGLWLDPDGAHHVNVRFASQGTAVEQGRFAVEVVQHSASGEQPDKVEEAGGVRFDIVLGPQADTQK